MRTTSTFSSGTEPLHVLQNGGGYVDPGVEDPRSSRPAPRRSDCPAAPPTREAPCRRTTHHVRTRTYDAGSAVEYRPYAGTRSQGPLGFRLHAWPGVTGPAATVASSCNERSRSLTDGSFSPLEDQQVAENRLLGCQIVTGRHDVDDGFGSDVGEVIP